MIKEYIRIMYQKRRRFGVPASVALRWAKEPHGDPTLDTFTAPDGRPLDVTVETEHDDDTGFYAGLLGTFHDVRPVGRSGVDYIDRYPKDPQTYQRRYIMRFQFFKPAESTRSVRACLSRHGLTKHDAYLTAIKRMRENMESEANPEPRRFVRVTVTDPASGREESDCVGGIPEDSVNDEVRGVIPTLLARFK